jgi:hypothetical protein
MTEQPSGTLRARISHVLAIRSSVAWATFACFAWGTVVLAIRFAGAESTRIALWAGLAGIATAVLVAVVRSRRDVPSERALRALVDRDSGAGGLLMAASDTDLGPWASELPRAAAHRIRWNAGRPLFLLVLSGIFVWAAFVIPARFVKPSPRLDIGPETNRIEEQLEVLKEEQILDIEQAELIQEQLDQLEKDAAGSDPSETWESLDNLSETLEKAADEAAEDAVQDMEALASLETLSEGLGEAAAAMDPGDLSEAMKDLGERTAEAAAANAVFAAAVSPELAEALASGTATPEQLAALARAAGMSKEQLRQTLEAMSAAGLADRKTMEQAEAAGQKGSSRGLSEHLRQNPGQGLSPSAMAAAGQGSGQGQGNGDGPGSGGVSRGPGHAALQFSSRTEDDGRFREVVLPRSAIDPESVSIPIASSPGLPDMPGDDVTPAAGDRAGALAGAAAGGGSAVRQQIRPRHREAVSRYFERKKP